MTATKLTAKQELFCLEYLKDLNATQAAIRAEYSENTAQQIGAENLSKPVIAEKLQELFKKRQEKINISADETLKDIVNIKERCMQEVTPKLEKDLDGNWIENGEYEFDSKAALKACELLGRHLGLFNDKLKITGGLSSMSEAELEVMLEDMEKNVR